MGTNERRVAALTDQQVKMMFLALLETIQSREQAGKPLGLSDRGIVAIVNSLVVAIDDLIRLQAEVEALRAAVRMGMGRRP